MTSLVFGSRLPVGSSARISRGAVRRARARSPPAAARRRTARRADAAGDRRARPRPAPPPRARAPRGAGDALQQRGEHRVLERGHLAEEVVELEDEADLRPAVARQPRLRPREEVLARRRARGPPWAGRACPAGGAASTCRRPEAPIDGHHLARVHGRGSPRAGRARAPGPMRYSRSRSSRDERAAHSYRSTSTGSSAPARRAGDDRREERDHERGADDRGRSRRR